MFRLNPREYLDYDPSTGIFTWIKKIGRSTKLGSRAGSVNKSNGYRYIRFNGKAYLEHRLAYWFMVGVFPDKDIDHRDRNKENNSWLNLREASDSENKGNCGLQINNSSGVRGVSWHSFAGKWIAHIGVNGKLVHLGYYNSREDASLAFQNAAKEHFGEFYCND